MGIMCWAFKIFKIEQMLCHLTVNPKDFSFY